MNGRIAWVVGAVAAFWLATVNLAAAEVLWSSIATACTPDRNSIQGDRYTTSPDNFVAPKTGAVDRISLVCPVAIRSTTSPDILSMTYRDSTATSASARVLMQFIAVNRQTGVRTLIAMLNSDSYTQTILYKRLSRRFLHTLSAGNFYYVRIELDRTLNSEAIQSIGVALEKAVPTSISVTSSVSSLTIGETAQYGATARYADSSTETVTAKAEWSSTATSVATINQNGLATGQGEGTTTIRAKVGNVVGSSQLQVLAPPPFCSDGRIEGDEQCDDGDTSNGDGCSASCAIEDDYQCTGEPSVCSIIPICGDGNIDAGEQCDDGDSSNGDGCSASCAIEDGYECTGEPSVCTQPMCLLANDCNDGSACTEDLCNSGSCEYAFSAPGSPCPGGQCDGAGACVPVPICGDGSIEGAEQCDDGDTSDGDGCSASCAIEGGYECSGEPSTCNIAACTPSGCGDDGNACTDPACINGSCGFVFNTAQCDDGDACTVNEICSNGSCGSGVPRFCSDSNMHGRLLRSLGRLCFHAVTVRRR